MALFHLYRFDEDTERLMIANDPNVSRVFVDATCLALPNLAARLGGALYQSSHINELQIHFDCFENEERDSSLSAIMQWIGTSSTLATLHAFACGSPVSPRTRTLLEWCLDTLCNNRPLFSLPPLENINIHYGSMSANTFARILQACRPAMFTFLGDMNQGSLASSNDAIEHIRSAVSTSTSLRKLSLAVRSPNVDAHCAIIEALPHHVTLERRAIFSAPLGGRPVVPQQLLDCLLPRLENHLIALEQIELSDFIWTETTISILDHFLPYHSDSLNFLKWFFGQNIMKNSNF